MTPPTFSYNIQPNETKEFLAGLGYKKS